MFVSLQNQGALYAVLNLENGSSVATRVRAATTSRMRRIGLKGIERLAEGCGLWIAPTEAIHTFGLKMHLDVVFLDSKLRVRKLVSGLAPRRFSICIAATSVLELRAGTIRETNTKVGDRLQFALAPENPYLVRTLRPGSLEASCT